MRWRLACPVPLGLSYSPSLSILTPLAVDLQLVAIRLSAAHPIRGPLLLSAVPYRQNDGLFLVMPIALVMEAG